MGLTFAAIDVETANRNRGSVCSFGVVTVQDGSIRAKHRFLCQPPDSLGGFDTRNVAIHGIHAEDIAGAPSFAETLGHVVALVGELPVIAHNAAFDIGAIRSGCNADQIDWPTLTYACSLTMARRAELELLSYRLPIVCEALGVESGIHHHADDDAEAAARIVLALADRRGACSLEELTDGLMVRLGHITRTEWAARAHHFAGASNRPSGGTPDVDPDHPLCGKLIAFTGELSIVRADVWALVTNLGATPKRAPTKETDFLVIGDGFTGNSAAEFHTGKAAKAVKINSKGGHIEVLTEGDLMDMLEDVTTSGVILGPRRGRGDHETDRPRPGPHGGSGGAGLAGRQPSPGPGPRFQPRRGARQ